MVARKAFTVRLTTQQYGKLRALALVSSRPMAVVIRQLVEQAMRRLK